MVGQIRPSAPQSELRGRLAQTPQSGGRYQGIGLVAAAGAIAQGGNALLAGVEQYEAAERAKRDFRTLTNFVKMTGEFTREAEELKLGLPPDGSGYEALVTERFRERFEEFSSGLEPDEVEEFNFRGETFQQNVLTQARNFSSEAAEGYALATVDSQVEGLMKSVYENPAMRFAAKQQVADLLARAPISAQMKAERAARAAKLIDGSGLSGTLRENYRRRTVVPNSPEVENVWTAVVAAESGGNPTAVSPKGAAGVGQVMPETAREVAALLGDKNFPYRGSDQEVRQYLFTKNEGAEQTNSEIYGRFYLNQRLKEFNGDVELALIAYNAGSERAKAYRDSGRDWAALPQGVQEETRPYVSKIFGQLGILQDNDIFDGGYELSFEQQTAALGAIEQQREVALQDQSRLAALYGDEVAARAVNATSYLYDLARDVQDGKKDPEKALADARAQFEALPDRISKEQKAQYRLQAKEVIDRAHDAFKQQEEQKAAEALLERNRVFLQELQITANDVALNVDRLLREPARQQGDRARPGGTALQGREVDDSLIDEYRQELLTRVENSELSPSQKIEAAQAVKAQVAAAELQVKLDRGKLTEEEVRNSPRFSVLPASSREAAAEFIRRKADEEKRTRANTQLARIGVDLNSIQREVFSAVENETSRRIPGAEATAARIDGYVEDLLAKIDASDLTEAEKIENKARVRAAAETAELTARLGKGEITEAQIATEYPNISLQQRTEALNAVKEKKLAEMDVAFQAEVQKAEVAVFNAPGDAAGQIARLSAMIDEMDISDAAKQKNKNIIAGVLNGAAMDGRAEEGELGASYANPERYRGVPLSQRREAAALQERVVAQEVAQLRADQLAEREKQRATLNVAIDGGAGFSVIEDAVKNGVLTAGSSEYDAAVKRFESVNEEAIALQDALTRFNDPNNTYSPTKEDRDELSSIAAQLGLPEKLKARDPEAIANLLLPVFTDANGVLPENVRQTLFTMAQSPNASEVGYAYKALETLYRKNGGAFTREFAGQEEIIRQTEYFSSMANAGVPEAAAVTRMVSLRSPEQQKVLRELEEQADKTLREDFTLDNLRAEFSSSFPSLYGERGAFGENEAQVANTTRLYGSYREAFRSWYILTGDKDKAHDGAMQSLNRQFGMFSGALVKYPPQTHVPAFDGGHEWVTRQFERDLRIEPGDTYYVVNDDDVSGARVRQGAAPSYMFVVVRKDGSAEAPRWAPSIEAERVYGANLAARTREDPTQEISVIEQNVRLRSQQAGDMLGLMREYIDADPVRRLQIKNTLSAGYAGVDFPQETGPALELLNRTRRQIERGVEIPETAKFWLRGGSNAGN